MEFEEVYDAISHRIWLCIEKGVIKFGKYQEKIHFSMQMMVKQRCLWLWTVIDVC